MAVGMTTNIRALLTQIARFEKQQLAGVTPPVADLTEFFETARQARLEVAALDAGLRPPAIGAPLLPPLQSAPLRFVQLDPTRRVQFPVSLPLAARIVLEELPRTPVGTIG